MPHDELKSVITPVELLTTKCCSEPWKFVAVLKI